MALLSKGQQKAVYYHSLFDYRLTSTELKKWEAGEKVKVKVGKVSYRSSFQELQQRKLLAKKKMKLARKAASLIGTIPTVKMVAVTGALAMQNTPKESDIDLMIITKANFLWSSRLLVYLLLQMADYAIREPGEKAEKDRLCLNLWLDETVLVWPKRDRNLYTAHEIAQIVPLFNKDNSYERLMGVNGWIKEYWPKATTEFSVPKISFQTKISLLELIAFKLQYLYMKRKMSREVVTLHKALFHPRNWAKLVLERLSTD